jgi:integrase
MMPVKRITQSVIRALEPPASGNLVVWDKDVAGFGVRITSGGTIAFVLNYTLNGRERRFTIGKHPDWSPSAARQEAIRLRGDVSRGEDPLGRREHARGAPTMADLCDRYMERHAELHKRPSAIEGDQQGIDRAIKPKLGRRKVAEVTFNDVSELHQSLRRTPYRANRIVALLSKMFSLAIKWRYRTDNPCRGVERFHESRRERYLKPEELQRLLQALAAHPDTPSANAIKLLVMTGARRGEVLSATWDQFDFDRGVWTKPSSHTKQKRQHVVPLSAQALALLSRMKADREKKGDRSEFLFPSPSGEGPQKALKRFWASVCRTAGLDGFRVHDLRHSFASYLASSGASLHLIGDMLGHTQPATTHRYAHLLDDPKRKAADHVGAFIAAAEGVATATLSSLNAPIAVTDVEKDSARPR